MKKILYEEEDCFGGSEKFTDEMDARAVLTPLRGEGRFINSVDYDDSIEAMKIYAKRKCEEQRQLLHESLNKMCNFDNESEKSNLIIEIMSKTEYPKFD